MLPPIVAKTPIAAKTSEPKGFTVLGNLIFLTAKKSYPSPSAEIKSSVANF